jgi:hypothetical protein
MAFLATALAAAACAAPTAARAATCTGGAAIKGTYGVLVSGANTNGVAKYLNGVLSFDGACGIAGMATIGEPGVATQNFASVSGSYTKNSDGTISLSLTLPNVAAPETYVVGMSQIAYEALGEETDSSAVATIDLRPQNPTNPATKLIFNNASLQGTYAAACIGGSAGTFSDLNFFSFDGKTNGSGAGSIKGVDDSNNGAQFYDEPYVGTYAVLANGNFGGAVTVAGGTYGFSGVITNAGKQISFIYTNPSSVAFVSCIGKLVTRTTK